ncbi:MAG: DUF29 domain-containing protein [Acidobacteriota bacterium]
MTPVELYDRDFYQWAVRNAELLRSGKMAEADIAHIAEELEDMGKSEKRELGNRLIKLITHLLKYRMQPRRRSRSWRVTIASQRIAIGQLLGDNPSLAAGLEQAVADVYRPAVRLAAAETDVPAEELPQSCPFTAAQILDEDYLPQ